MCTYNVNIYLPKEKKTNHTRLFLVFFGCVGSTSTTASTTKTKMLQGGKGKREIFSGVVHREMVWQNEVMERKKKKKKKRRSFVDIRRLYTMRGYKSDGSRVRKRRYINCERSATRAIRYKSRDSRWLIILDSCEFRTGFCIYCKSILRDMCCFWTFSKPSFFFFFFEHIFVNVHLNLWTSNVQIGRMLREKNEKLWDFFSNFCMTVCFVRRQRNLLKYRMKIGNFCFIC